MRNGKYFHLISVGVFCVLGLKAWAESPKIHVIPLHGSKYAKDLEGGGVQVHGQKESNRSELPERQVREKVFAKAGLSEELKSWDEVERDMFWLSARNMRWEDLKAKYPQIPVEKLRRFQGGVSRIR